MKKYPYAYGVLQRLAKKVIRGKATEKEINFLDNYYDFFDSLKNEIPQISGPEKDQINNEIKIKLADTIASDNVRPIYYNITKVAAVIALVLVATVCLYKYKQHNAITSGAVKLSAKNTIAPGGNKATLTLSNGSKIDLTDQKNGMLARQSGVQVTKTASGKLLYSYNSTTANHKANLFNTLQTPKGGTYQIALPDGTQVWLNSASVLKYPVAFTSSERRVELSGEAYFEVAHNKNKPFRVVSGNQVIEVLGTHFNINAYADEANSLTTLLEGSVRVRNLASNSFKMLVPGQQATVGATQIKIKNVDADKAIAWKNGLFQFDNEDIHDIMRKLARWYDVDVEYQDELKDVRFGGTVSRYADIREVLKKFELTNTIHFKIIERRIILMK